MYDITFKMFEPKSIKYLVLDVMRNLIYKNKTQKIVFSIQHFVLIIFFLFISFVATSQQTNKPSNEPIIIIGAQREHFQDLDTAGKFMSLAGNAIVKQGKTTISADSMVVDNVNKIVEAFGNVHINDADSVHTYAQYAKYLGKEKKAFLKNKVMLTDGKGTLTTDDLDYDAGIKIGTYRNGGKLVNGKTILTSKEGHYYGETRDVYFYKDVEMFSPDTKIFTDTLLYNINTDITRFVSITTIFNGKKRIVTREGIYDPKHNKSEFGKRTFIEDSSYTIVSDTMIQDSTGRGEFKGNAVYRTKDAKNGFDLIANNIKTNSKTNTILATEKPILFIKQDVDTIFVTADTLFSARLTDLKKKQSVSLLRDTIKGKYEIKFDKDSSNDRYFQAFNNVKIFNDSIQAVADSMFYSSVDSVLRLFNTPIVWASDNQLTGDTMYLYIKNKNPEKLLVYENAMAISKVNNSFYNQLKGNSITGYFKDGKIDILKTKGSPAQNVYYAEDENKKLVGVNQSAADLINIEFKDDKPERVVFVNNLQGTMFPINQVNHKELQVKNFKWLIQLRPTKIDVIGN